MTPFRPDAAALALLPAVPVLAQIGETRRLLQACRERLEDLSPKNPFHR